jgi:hypothetical protein
MLEKALSISCGVAASTVPIAASGRFGVRFLLSY